MPPHARFCGFCGNPRMPMQTRKLPAVPIQAAPESPIPSSQSPSSILPDQHSAHLPTVHLSPIQAAPEQSMPSQPPSPLLPDQHSAHLPAVHLPVAPSGSPMPSALLKQRYQIMRKLGAGGYGIVYQASDTEFGGRPVAIKEMSQAELDLSQVANATEAFKREAFMLAALTHPNLPSIYDYFTENGRWYLVMSYIEGETLDEYLARLPEGKLPVEKVLALGTQIAAVLSYLHTRNPAIIFRDLKPSNIMRTPEGQIYLIDFGIARHFKVGQTKDTIALGSPGYAAPEQYGRAQTTPQADIYSLGATLHHMLTGLDPSTHPFNHPPLHIPRYPQLSILIACMLEIDPRRRPSSMGNIKRELQRIATGHSSHPSDNSSSRDRNYPKNNRTHHSLSMCHRSATNSGERSLSFRCRLSIHQINDTSQSQSRQKLLPHTNDPMI